MFNYKLIATASNILIGIDIFDGDINNFTLLKLIIYHGNIYL